MTNGSRDRLDRIEESLQRSIIASDERMTRYEQERATDRKESNERLTRIEQIVESNNRFLEGFSQRIERYTARMDNLAHKLDNFSTRTDGMIFTANQDRQETNTRLAGIQRQIKTIENKIDFVLDGSNQIEGGDNLPA